MVSDWGIAIKIYNLINTERIFRAIVCFLTKFKLPAELNFTMCKPPPFCALLLIVNT